MRRQTTGQRFALDRDPEVNRRISAIDRDDCERSIWIHKRE